MLIGHSLGGLILKSLVVKAHHATHEAAGHQPANRVDKHKKFMCTKFLENIRGIIFYGVPHSGSIFGGYLKNLDKTGLFRLAGIMKNLCPYQNDMQLLSVEFKKAIDPKRVTLYAFAEGSKYKKVHSLPKP